MSPIKPGKRVVLDEPTEEMEGQIPEFVRRDAATLPRDGKTDSDAAANSIVSLLQRVAGSSVQEVDRLIGELHAIRQLLHNEGARVQSEIVEYANLSQSAMQSTSIISESLTKWKAAAKAHV